MQVVNVFINDFCLKVGIIVVCVNKVYKYNIYFMIEDKIIEKGKCKKVFLDK